MTRAAHFTSRVAYPGTLAMLGLALAFPIALMIFDPTLMFERGWEQYVGTAIYAWAVLTLGNELFRLWGNEKGFNEAPAQLADPATIAEDDRRILPSRLRQIAAAHDSPSGRMELNREASGLDQEAAGGRFTLTRYILYLLPVIGFIGTVEGISKALMNISRVLPMVKNLDGFMGNLTSVTSALQIAFDSTLLALFLSAALMLAQTLVIRRSEDLLARVDRWVVDHVLSAQVHAPVPAESQFVAQLELIHRDLAALADKLGDGLGRNVDRFSVAVEGLSRGAETMGRMGDDLSGLSGAGDSLRKGLATLSRIETALAADSGPDEQLDAIRRGVDRQVAALDNLASQWSAAFERSSKTTQDQLARTLGSLKDALDLLNVSMEQGNSLYRNIVKTKFSVYREEAV
ncbi:MAG: biopolymer transport protein [Planctomycetota bacterium]|nr:biopolymer transport protein [Planctomycetota bacterium]